MSKHWNQIARLILNGDKFCNQVLGGQSENARCKNVNLYILCMSIWFPI
jgi:hypothetical protein